MLITEVLLTFIFLLVILGSTDDRAPKGFAGISIGLTLTLITSSRSRSQPRSAARSTGVAFFNGAGAPGQLWAFWLAPLAGAALAGALYPKLFGAKDEKLAGRPVRDSALER